MSKAENIYKTRSEIFKLTDKERLLLLLMISDYAKGNIFYKDAPKNLTDVFLSLLPKAAKHMDNE